MRQKLVPFSLLLIISLLAWTANAGIDENVSEENFIEENITEGNITEEGISEEDISEEAISEDEISEDEISEEAISEDEISEDEISEEAISEEAISEEAISEDEISEDEISEDEISEDEISEDEISEDESSEEDNTNEVVNISYNASGPFKMEDVVGITATFSKPVSLATLTVNDDSPIDMASINDKVWYCEYVVVPDEVDDPVDVFISAVDEDGNSIDEIYDDAFVIDNTAPELILNEPELKFGDTNYVVVGTNDVVFNLSASDNFDDSINYTFYFNGTEIGTGELNRDECKLVELNNLDEGHYTWEVKLEDDAGNIYPSDFADLYVDTEAPEVTLISPENHLIDKGDCFNLSFTAKDDFTEQYKDLKLRYDLSFDGEVVEEQSSVEMRPWQYIQVPCSDLENGAHEWSVDVYDEAGNNVTSETRYIYVDKEDLRILLISPDGGYASANTTFKFRVSGGAKMPFDYKLLINGEEVESSICEEGTYSENEEEEEEYISEDEGAEDSITEDEGEEDSITEDEGAEDSISEDEGAEDSITEDEIDEDDDVFDVRDNTLFLGEEATNYYTVEAEVPDGDGIEWTVLITDCTGDTYQPDPCYFSLDTAAPERVANLSVTNMAGEAEGADSDYPRLYVGWDENTENDLASMPYEVFVSDFAPTSLEDMEKIGSTSDTSFYIDEYGGEPLADGKDYWVAVIARDNAGNYNNCFVSIYGPVQTCGDLNSGSLENSISDASSGFLTVTESEDINSDGLNDSISNINSELLEEEEILESSNDSVSNTSSGILTETKLSGNSSDFNSNTNYEFLSEDENSEKLRDKFCTDILRNIIPQVNKTSLKTVNTNSLAKNQVSESAEDSAEPKSTPGFHITCSAMSILLLAFGLNFKRKTGKKL